MKKTLNLANRISLARIVLVPFFVMALFYSSTENKFLKYLPVIIFSAAMLTDFLDGIIARGLMQKTDLGKILDPFADKVLIITAYICLSFMHYGSGKIHLPVWVPVIIISRDIILIIGAALLLAFGRKLNLRPSKIGKVTTFFQMSTIIALLLYYPHTYILWNIASILTVISGVIYIIQGSKLFNEPAS